MGNKNKKARKKKKPHKPIADRKQMLQNSIKNVLPNTEFVWKDNGDKLSEVIVEFAQEGRVEAKRETSTVFHSK